VIDAGLGEAQLTAFFATMKMPRMTFPTLKKHERAVGMVIETYAQRSMVRVAKLEKFLTIL
jgi:hypothetical protein